MYNCANMVIVYWYAVSGLMYVSRFLHAPNALKCYSNGRIRGKKFSVVKN